MDRSKSRLKGPMIVAANHISHFDPPLLSAAALRPIHWMAMVELFENPVAGAYLRALGAIPTDRRRVERSSLRTALDRLKKGHVVGVFPEGGIRAGATSILGGARMRPGVATIAEMAGVPIVPCIVIGSDRLYARQKWWPPRQVTFWVGFGDPIRPPEGLSRKDTRVYLEEELTRSLRSLFSVMRERFSLKDDDLPQAPGRRKGRE